MRSSALHSSTSADSCMHRSEAAAAKQSVQATEGHARLGATATSADAPKLRCGARRCIRAPPRTHACTDRKQQQPSKVFKRLKDMLDWVRPRLQPTHPNFDAELGAAFEHLLGLMHAQIGSSSSQAKCSSD